jgi:hypothetical protein
MDRFDPAIASPSASLPDGARDLPHLSGRSQGFGERPIGELVRAIVARLDQGPFSAPVTG